MVISSYVACGSFFHHIRCFIVRSSTRPNLHNQPGVRLRPPPPHTHTQTHPFITPPLPQPSLTIGQWVALCRQCTHIHAHTHVLCFVYTQQASLSHQPYNCHQCVYVLVRVRRATRSGVAVTLYTLVGWHARLAPAIDAGHTGTSHGTARNPSISAPLRGQISADHVCRSLSPLSRIKHRTWNPHHTSCHGVPSTHSIKSHTRCEIGDITITICRRRRLSCADRCWSGPRYFITRVISGRTAYRARPSLVRMHRNLSSVYSLHKRKETYLT